MVQLSELYHKRVVFIDDAAHSTTFLSGMGAPLGMLDGKLLAAALADTPAPQRRYKISIAGCCQSADSFSLMQERR